MRYHSPKPLEVYVIWHPDCHEATSIAGQVKNHFGTHRFQNVMGGRGINMKFLRISDFGSSIPIHAEFPAVAVALIDGLFVEDNNYLEGLKILGEKIEKHGNGSRLLPVSIETGLLDNLNLHQQVLQLDQWNMEKETRTHRLIRELRMNSLVTILMCI